MPLISNYIKDSLGLAGDDVVVVAPDAGRIKTAEKLREYLHADLAFLYKRRSRTEAHKIEEMTVVGEVEGRPCVLVDDMIDTAATLTKGVHALAAMKAGPIFTGATHAIFSGKAVQNLEEAPIEQVIVTNTVPIPEEKQFAEAPDPLDRAADRVRAPRGVRGLERLRDLRRREPGLGARRRGDHLPWSSRSTGLRPTTVRQRPASGGSPSPHLRPRSRRSGDRPACRRGQRPDTCDHHQRRSPR